MTKKIKVLTISDHPLAPSGVGTQTKYICEALLNSGRFSIFSLGGAVKHQNYRPISVDPFGDDWRIIPIDGFGSQEMIRSILRTERPDILWFMTDPRFFPWLWEIENEIRPLVPMIYYHVWDNHPPPLFNRNFYLSNDKIFTISKVTDEIVSAVAPEVDREYLPHAVASGIFHPMTDEEIFKIRQKSLPESDQNKVIFFWNNRNARRKQSGTLIFWFKDFLDKYNLHNDAMLLMHTDPKDPHGQDLEHIINFLNLDKRQVLISKDKLPIEALRDIYNMVDCTINISDAEGFGLATLESISCGTPIIVNMTGGLQEQIITSKGHCGLPVFPTSKALIGSQQVPYIYEDRINKDQFISALWKMYSLGKGGRKELGLVGRDHVIKNYNFEKFRERWLAAMIEVYETYGSWDTRKLYNGIRLLEVA